RTVRTVREQPLAKNCRFELFANTPKPQKKIEKSRKNRKKNLKCHAGVKEWKILVGRQKIYKIFRKLKVMIFGISSPRRVDGGYRTKKFLRTFFFCAPAAIGNSSLGLQAMTLNLTLRV